MSRPTSHARLDGRPDRPHDLPLDGDTEQVLVVGSQVALLEAALQAVHDKLQHEDLRNTQIKLQHDALVADLRYQLQAAHRRAVEATGKLQRWQRGSTTTQERFEALMEKLVQTECENQHLASRLQHAQDEVVRLQDALGGTQNELNHLRDMVEPRQAAVAAHAVEIERLAQQCERLLEEQAQTQVRSARAQEQLGAEEARVAALEAEIQQLQSRPADAAGRTVASRQLAQLTQALVLAQRRVRSVSARRLMLQAQLESLAAQADGQARATAHLAAQRDTALVLNSHLQRQWQAAKERAGWLVTQLEAVQTTITALTLEVEQMRAQAQQQAKTIVALETERAAAKADGAELWRWLKHSEDNVAQLQAQLARMETESARLHDVHAEELQAQSRALRLESEALQAELTRSQEEVARLSRQLAQREPEEAAAGEMGELVALLERVQGQLTQAQLETKALKRERDRLEALLEGAYRQLGSHSTTTVSVAGVESITLDVLYWPMAYCLNCHAPRPVQRVGLLPIPHGRPLTKARCVHCGQALLASSVLKPCGAGNGAGQSVDGRPVEFARQEGCAGEESNLSASAPQAPRAGSQEVLAPQESQVDNLLVVRQRAAYLQSKLELIDVDLYPRKARQAQIWLQNVSSQVEVQRLHSNPCANEPGYTARLDALEGVLRTLEHETMVELERRARASGQADRGNGHRPALFERTWQWLARATGVHG